MQSVSPIIAQWLFIIGGILLLGFILKRWVFLFRRKKISMLEEAYNFIAKQPLKYYSNNFKNYVDKNYKNPEWFTSNPFRKAIISGYFLKCAENLVKTKEIIFLGKDIINVLNSQKNDVNKVKKLANFFDNHDKIGLPKELDDYMVFDVNEIKNFFVEIANDYIQHLSKERTVKKGEEENLTELVYRNMSFGYLYKLSEDLLDYYKNTNNKTFKRGI